MCTSTSGLNRGTHILQSTTQPYKGVNYWYTKQLGWVSKESCWVKKKAFPEGYKLYDCFCHSWNDKIIEVENRDRRCGKKERGCTYKRTSQRIPVIELFRILSVGIDTQTYRCDTTVLDQTHTYTQTQVQIKWGIWTIRGSSYQGKHLGCDIMPVLQDATSGEMRINGTWEFSVLFLTTLFKSTIISIKFQLKMAFITINQHAKIISSSLIGILYPSYNQILLTF